jgi:hypothetical protein
MIELLRMILGLMVGFVIGTLIYAGYDWLRCRREAVRQMRRELHWYRQLVRTRSGFTLGYGNYRIVSFDKGGTWYHYETTDDEPIKLYGGLAGNWGMRLLGKVEPEVVAHLDGMDLLCQRVASGDPLDLTRADDRAALEAAGFTVTGT